MKIKQIIIKYLIIIQKMMLKPVIFFHLMSKRKNQLIIKEKIIIKM